MKKLWSFTQKLRPIKGIGKKRPEMHPNFFAEYGGKLYFTLVNWGGDCTLIYEYDPKTQTGTDLYELGGIIWAAPVVDGKIYFFSDTGEYLCFDLDARSLAFEQELAYIDGDIVDFPVIIGGDIYFLGAKALNCADLETGELRWKMNFDFKYDMRFFQFKDCFIVYDCADKIYCVSRQKEILWQSNVEHQYVYIYKNNIILYAANDQTNESKIHLLDGGTGKLLSTHEGVEESYPIEVVADGIVLKTGMFAIADNKFQQSWPLRIKGQFITGSACDDQKLYLCDEKKNFYTIDIKSGETSIETPELVMKKPHEIYLESGKLYVFGTNVELDCFEL